MTIRELSLASQKKVTGAGGRNDPVGQYHCRPAGGQLAANSSPSDHQAQIADCNNSIIGGMIAGARGGVWGLGLGLVAGVISGHCFGNGSGANNNSNNANSNCGGGSATNSPGGSCSW